MKENAPNNDDILDALRLIKRLQGEVFADREAWLTLTMAYEHVARQIEAPTRIASYCVLAGEGK